MAADFMTNNDEFAFMEEQSNNNIFSFMNFPNNGMGLDSPLSSPFLQEDEFSPPHVGSSDLSSPEVSSPDFGQGLSTNLLFSDPAFESLLSGESMEEVDGGMILLDQTVKTEQTSTEEAKEEKKGKKGRGKKRARRNENESTDVSAVILTREQILNFSSEDLDKFVEAITVVRPLTYAEEKELKRQRRLIKNRESAQASRQRKKVYVDELEAEISKLKAQNNQLSGQVGQLVFENRSLKDELQKLHTLVKKTGLIADNSTTKIYKPQETSHVGGSPQQKAKAGVCLLILLFSFGLFFNVDKGPAKSFLARTNVNIPKFIESVPGMGGAPMFAGNTPAPTTRRILELDSKDPKNSIHKEPMLSPHQPLVSERLETNPTKSSTYQHQHQVPVHKISINNGEERRHGATIGTPSSAYDEIDRHKRIVNEKVSEDTNSQFMAEFAEMMNDSINQNVSELHDVEMQKWFAERLKIRPNTAFFSVTDFHQIIPPNMLPFDSNSPFFVSLLVPARSLANQLPASSNNVVDNSMIEVTCQVVSVNQTNLDLDAVNNIRQVPVMA